MPKPVVRNTIVITTLSTRVDEQNYKHQPQQTVRRVGFADRVALHVGLALVTWSRRPLVAAPARDARLAQRRHQLALEQREHQWLSLGQPRR
jgi:hypothetical protein